MHVLAGAVDAALGIEIGIERTGGFTALDATVGQVEGTQRQIEERVLAAIALGHE